VIVIESSLFYMKEHRVMHWLRHLNRWHWTRK